MWSEDAVWRPQAACVPLSYPLTAESRPDQGFGTRDPLTLCAHPSALPGWAAGPSRQDQMFLVLLPRAARPEDVPQALEGA